MNQKKSDPAIGIDLGDSQSAIALLDPVKGPRVIRNAEGDRTTPSVILHTGEQTMIGSDAMEAAAFEPCLLRAMRSQNSDSARVAAHLLRKLSADAAQKVGEFDRAVIAVCDSMSPSRRRASREAAQSAGLDEVVLLDQTLAAAIAFAAEKDWLLLNNESTCPIKMLVYSWGAGPFTAAIIEYDNGKFRRISSASANESTGLDFDTRLMAHFADAFFDKFGIDLRQDAHACLELRRTAQRVKHALARRKSFTVCIAQENQRLQIVVDQSILLKLTRDLLKQSCVTVQAVLDDADLTWADIDHLVLTGGLTRLRVIRRMMEKQSGLRPDSSLSVDESISHGAAIHAWSLWKQGDNVSTGGPNEVCKWMRPIRLVAATSQGPTNKIKLSPRKMTGPALTGDKTAQSSHPAKLRPLKKLARRTETTTPVDRPVVSANTPADQGPRIEIKTDSPRPTPVTDYASIDLGIPDTKPKLRSDEINLIGLASISTHPPKIDSPIMIDPKPKITSDQQSGGTVWKSRGKRLTPKEEM
jgi:actin-like ATPase involved in cell morphogenesis